MKGLNKSVSLLALAMASGAGPSYAQSTATQQTSQSSTTAEEDPQANTDGKLEEIVVTAQRRSEQLQRVPISITALTANTLSQAGVNDTQSLVAVTPGLQLTSNRTAVVPFLRGVGTSNVSPGDEGSTAIYVDGVLSPVAGANVFALNNVERVEVLRGPQGTLFGRNAVGGLINVITKDPSQQFGGNIELGYGNYETFIGSAYVTGGITPDVAADLSLYMNHQSKGWGRNSTLGIDTNRNREFAARSKVLWELGADTGVTLSGDYNHSLNDIGSTRQAIPGSLVTGGLRFRGTIYDNFGEIRSYGKKTQFGASAKVEHSLGVFKVQSTTAYRNYDIDAALDSDGYALNTTGIFTHEKTETFQQEIILNGSMGHIDFTTGVFYFFSHAKYRPFTTTSGVRAASNTVITADQVTNSYAGFAQATYNLTDTTRLTAGLRYTRDDRTLEATQVAGAGHTAPAGTVLARSDTLPASQTERSFGKLTWRGALDQQLTETVLAFASISRGFKSGVFALASPFAPSVDPETLDAYEAGIKADLFDRSLRVNISAFHYSYKNIQLSSLSAANAPLLVNAAAGKINGIDGDIVYVVPTNTGRLQLRASASYLDAQYSSFPAALVYTPLPAGGNAPSTRDASGNRFINSPKFTSSMGFDYETPLGDVGTLGLTATWSHNSGFFWDVGNRIREPSFDVVNGQISLATADDTWKIRLFAKNLFDEEYYLYVSPGSFGDTGAAAAPRTYGLAVSRTF